MTKKTIYDFATKKTIVRDLTSDEQKARDEETSDKDIDLANLRSIRNSLLAETDWRSLVDAPTMSDAWKKYRQDLRDITKTFQSMSDKDFKFPTKPS